MQKFFNRVYRSLYRRTIPPLKVVLSELKILTCRRRWMQLDWEPIADGSVERVEPAKVQFNSHLYVIGGYRDLDEVISGMQVLDMTTGQWVRKIEKPNSIAQTHCGIVGEANRYIYFIAGQVGIQCSPAVKDCHVYDIETEQWSKIPSLPQVRYAPVTVLWKGRLHVMGGSQDDRVTPAREHWSIAVQNGKALEAEWKEEIPCPIGGPHRTSAVVEGVLYLLGAQHYDRAPIPGNPTFTCDGGPDTKTEIIFKECYKLESTNGHWQRLEDLPIIVSHSEYSTFVHGHKIFVLGGMTKGYKVTDLIQMYDTRKNQWTLVGRMPWKNKGLIVGHAEGWLYVAFGQIAISRFNSGFGEVTKSGFRARVNLDNL